MILIMNSNKNPNPQKLGVKFFVVELCVFVTLLSPQATNSLSCRQLQSARCPSTLGHNPFISPFPLVNRTLDRQV